MRATLSLAALALLPAMLAWAQEAAPVGAVPVHRGSATTIAPAVPILRGSSALGQPPGPAALAPSTLASGGSRLWLITPDAGELVACRLVGTTEVGRDRIRCTRRALPR